MSADFLHFLTESPTVWHAATEIGRRLKEAKFTPLCEKDPWTLAPGRNYFVERDGALLCAFRLPQKEPQKMVLLASHTDSPALKLKPHPNLSTRDISQLGTEIYGGPLLHSWLDRDLALAGRIETDRGSELVFLKQCPLVIPQLAIHLDRSIHEKGILVHKQDHLKAVFSLEGEPTLDTLLKKEHPFQKLYSFDLFLVPTEKPSLLGLHQEMLAGYRLDNLASAYASLQALLGTSSRSDAIQMVIFWDHEEIGSLSATGANSQYIDELLQRIFLSLDKTSEARFQMKSASLLLSIDVAHGWNPNYPEKYDPQNSPLLGHGTALKFNASRKYATDISAATAVMKIGEKRGLKLQQTANRSDIPSGSTVGPFMSAATGIATVDLGIPCWAMHSTREIIATKDLSHLQTLLSAVLEEG